MTKLQRKEIENAVQKSTSFTNACKILGLPANGNGIKKLKRLCEQYFIDISSLLDGHKKSIEKRVKYPRIEKKCPVCGNFFEAHKGSPKEKSTCSHACSNTYFRSGKQHPNWNNIKVESTKYRSICFSNHEKKCVVCGEEKIVAVHHYDENRKNNCPSNLIPLCPTHHGYIHSRYKKDIIDIVEKYIKDWKNAYESKQKLN